MSISLHSFCKIHNLPKSTVYDRAKAFGFDTSEGLSTDAQAALLKEFKLEEASEMIAKATAPTITVEVGNHCTALAMPQFEGQAFDLAQFRDSEALVIADPMAAAQQFLTVANMLTDAMKQDIRAREQRLQQTRQAQQAVAAKAQELALEKRLYQMQTAQVDAAQTTEAKTLADALTALQSLGKPVGADAAGQI